MRIKLPFIKILQITTLSLAVFFFYSCNSTHSEKKDKKDHATETHEHKDKHEGDHKDHKPHWSYEAETGPEHWKNLCDDFADCGGKVQSPIDISTTVEDASLKELDTDYKMINKLNAINNGHTVQVNYLPGSTFTIDSSIYELKQFHFHTPTEHTFNGKPYPMEIHLVHVNAEGQIAVIGIIVKEGEENPFFTPMINKLPDNEGKTADVEMQIDVNQLLPADKKYFNYTGSLTTPPCTEGVKWFVMKNHIEASGQQIKAISEMMPRFNARPVQELNGREVKQSL